MDVFAKLLVIVLCLLATLAWGTRSVAIDALCEFETGFLLGDGPSSPAIVADRYVDFLKLLYERNGLLPDALTFIAENGTVPDLEDYFTDQINQHEKMAFTRVSETLSARETPDEKILRRFAVDHLKKISEDKERSEAAKRATRNVFALFELEKYPMSGSLGHRRTFTNAAGEVFSIVRSQAKDNFTILNFGSLGKSVEISAVDHTFDAATAPDGTTWLTYVSPDQFVVLTDLSRGTTRKTPVREGEFTGSLNKNGLWGTVGPELLFDKNGRVFVQVNFDGREGFFTWDPDSGEKKTYFSDVIALPGKRMGQPFDISGTPKKWTLKDSINDEIIFQGRPTLSPDEIRASSYYRDDDGHRVFIRESKGIMNFWDAKTNKLQRAPKKDNSLFANLKSGPRYVSVTRDENGETMNMFNLLDGTSKTYRFTGYFTNEKPYFARLHDGRSFFLFTFKDAAWRVGEDWVTLVNAETGEIWSVVKNLTGQHVVKIMVTPDDRILFVTAGNFGFDQDLKEYQIFGPPVTK